MLQAAAPRRARASRRRARADSRGIALDHAPEVDHVALAQVWRRTAARACRPGPPPIRSIRPRIFQRSRPCARSRTRRRCARRGERALRGSAWSRSFCCHGTRPRTPDSRKSRSRFAHLARNRPASVQRDSRRVRARSRSSARRTLCGSRPSSSGIHSRMRWSCVTTSLRSPSINGRAMRHVDARHKVQPVRTEPRRQHRNVMIQQCAPAPRRRLIIWRR